MVKWGKADLLMIVYDVNKKASFELIDSWYHVANKGAWNGENGNPFASVLFANKTDVQSLHKVSQEDGKNKADQLNMEFFSGSAVS